MVILKVDDNQLSFLAVLGQVFPKIQLVHLCFCL